MYRHGHLQRSLPISLALVLLALLVAGCDYSLRDLDVLDETPDPFDPDALNFIVVGDWGRAGWFRQDDVADAMGETCEAVGCRFVVSTGDNFYVDGVESISDGKWERSYEDVYTAPSLHVPWFVTLGNHDYLGSVEAQLEYTDVSDRWELPARYYAVDATVADTVEALLVFLDTVSLVLQGEATEAFKGEARWEADRQLAWVDSTLAASDAAWKLVFGHHPIYSASAKHADSPELREKLRPVLEAHDVEAYISGHVHSLQHLEAPDSELHYFVSGGGSLARRVDEEKDALFAIGASGFMAVSLTPEWMHVRFIDHEGTVGYAVRIPERTEEG